MAISVMCAKGCGVAITVADETVREAQAAGAPINAAHEVCPRDRASRPQYSTVLSVYRQDYDPRTGEKTGDRVLLSERGVETHADNFREAHKAMSPKLTEEWAGMLKWADVVEQGIEDEHTG